MTVRKTKKRNQKPSKRAIQAAKNFMENNGNWYKAMVDAGFSPNYAKNPKLLVSTKTFEDLMKQVFPDYKLLVKHNQQLNATRLDHMVFPLGSDSKQEEGLDDEGADIPSGESTNLTDEDIIQMLAEINCTVRKIVHGETARHVYFWAADNKAQGSALELAYKIKGYLKNTNVVSPVQININEDREKYN